MGRKGTVGATTFTESPFWPIDTVYYVTKKRQDDWRYLYALLRFLDLSRLNAATGVPGLSRRDALAIRGAFPPLEEQRSIAAVLDAADAAIERAREALNQAVRLRDGLHQDLIRVGIDSSGRIRSLDDTQAFRQSEIGMIPKSWDVSPLRKIADVNRGRFSVRPRNDPQYYDGPFPFIQTGDITANRGGVISTYHQTLNDKGAKVSREFPAGAIAITIAANIADTAILGFPMWFPDSIVGAVVHPPNNSRFVELCIRASKRRLDALAPQSAQKNINLGDLRPLLIPIPKPEEQERIAEVYEASQRLVNVHLQRIELLHHLKRGLTQDLLTGKVRVPATVEVAGA